MIHRHVFRGGTTRRTVRIIKNLKERYQENGGRVLCDTYSAVTHVLAVLWENMTLWNHGSRCTGKRAWINSRHLKANWSHFEKSILYRNNTNIESEQSRLLALLFSLKDEQPPDPSNLSIGGLYMQVFSINNGALRGGVMAIADVNSPDFGLISVLLECKGNRLKV